MQNSQSSTISQDSADQGWGDLVVQFASLGCIAAMSWLAATMELQTADDALGLGAPPLKPCVMDQAGYFRGEIYGELRRSLDWTGATMLCDGMPRPEGAGIRLVFNEQTDSNLRGLVVVIGIADAVLGAPESELEANVTIIDQVAGKFYSTAEQPRCWTRLTNQLRLTGTIEETWRVDGQLYCASALAALTGPGSVTLSDIEYSSVMKPAAE